MLDRHFCFSATCLLMSAELYHSGFRQSAPEIVVINKAATFKAQCCDIEIKQSMLLTANQRNTPNECYRKVQQRQSPNMGASFQRFEPASNQEHPEAHAKTVANWECSSSLQRHDAPGPCTKHMEQKKQYCDTCGKYWDSRTQHAHS